MGLGLLTLVPLWGVGGGDGERKYSNWINCTVGDRAGRSGGGFGLISLNSEAWSGELPVSSLFPQWVVRKELGDCVFMSLELQ